jgi:hypothetical protein
MKKVRITTTDRNDEDMTICIDYVGGDEQDDSYSLFIDGGTLPDGKDIEIFPNLGLALLYAQEIISDLDKELG